MGFFFCPLLLNVMYFLTKKQIPLRILGYINPWLAVSGKTSSGKMVGTIFPLILPPSILTLMYVLYLLQHIILLLKFLEFFFAKSQGNLPE